MVDEQEQPVSQSLLKMKFFKGKILFILDTTGITDANDFTLGIGYAKLKDNMPIWAIEGSD